MKKVLAGIITGIALLVAAPAATAAPVQPQPPGTIWRGDGVNNSSTTLSLKNAEWFLASEGPAFYPDGSGGLYSTNALGWTSGALYRAGYTRTPTYDAYWISHPNTVRVSQTVVNAEIRTYNPWDRIACVIKGTVTGVDTSMRYNLNNGPMAHQEGCYYYYY